MPGFLISGRATVVRHVTSQSVSTARVIALNLSEKENQRNRELSTAAGLGGLVNVVDGSFEAIPLEDASVDVVWSQDAILHSGRRDQVISEGRQSTQARRSFRFYRSHGKRKLRSYGS